MIIELIGPAGSGKTTIARQLDGSWPGGTPCMTFEELERLNLEMGEKYILKRNLVGRARHLLPLLWQYPRLAVPILGLAVMHGPPFRRRWRKAQRSLAHFLFVLRLQQHKLESIIVLHEGFTQTLWSLLIDSRTLRGTGLVRCALAHYHAVIGQRGIRLLVDDETTKLRLFGRTSRGRFNRSSAPEQQHAFDRWLAYHRRLVALLPEAVVAGTIDATGSKQDVTRALADATANLAGGAQAVSAATETQTGAGTVLPAKRSSYPVADLN